MTKEEIRVGHVDKTTVWVSKETRDRIDVLKEPMDHVEHVIRRALDALEREEGRVK